MSKATITVFKEIKEEMKNDLQKGFMNLSKPANVINNQAFLSNSYSSPTISNTYSSPMLNF